MGAGKSSAAKTVAAELGVQALDSDHEIERELGEPIESWFERNGEAAFRKVEEEAVVRLLERPDLRVLALGGGSLGSERVQEALRRHMVVYLDVDTESAWHRCGGTRPLARDRNRFEQLHEERRPLYESLADAWLPAAERATVRAALPALASVARSPAAAKLLWGASSSGEYPVFFGHGLVASGFFHPEDGRRFVLSDQNVASLHALPGDWQHAIPAGEAAKTPEQAAAVLRAMAGSGVTRADLVAA